VAAVVAHAGSTDPCFVSLSASASVSNGLLYSTFGFLRGAVGALELAGLLATLA